MTKKYEEGKKIRRSAKKENKKKRGKINKNSSSSRLSLRKMKVSPGTKHRRTPRIKRLHRYTPMKIHFTSHAPENEFSPPFRHGVNLHFPLKTPLLSSHERIIGEPIDLPSVQTRQIKIIPLGISPPQHEHWSSPAFRSNEHIHLPSQYRDFRVPPALRSEEWNIAPQPQVSKTEVIENYVEQDGNIILHDKIIKRENNGKKTIQKIKTM